MDDGFEKVHDRGDRERALIAENQELIEMVGELERMCAEFHERDDKREQDPIKLVEEAEAGPQGHPHSIAEDLRLLRVQGIFKDLLHKNRLLDRDEANLRLQREMDLVQGKYQQAKDEVAALQQRASGEVVEACQSSLQGELAAVQRRLAAELRSEMRGLLKGEQSAIAALDEQLWRTDQRLGQRIDELAQASVHGDGVARFAEPVAGPSGLGGVQRVLAAAAGAFPAGWPQVLRGPAHLSRGALRAE